MTPSRIVDRPAAEVMRQGVGKVVILSVSVGDTPVRV